jgi:hypothetical protein
LLFPYGGEMFIARFSDSDYCNCIDSRQSLSGYLFKVGNSTISWQSLKQTSVSTSTTKAEYIALSKAAKYLLWLKTALNDLQIPETLMALLCDTCSAIDLAENYRISELSKHIDSYHQRIRELIYDKTLPLMYIRTMDNLVNICTLGLPEVQLSKLCAIA